MRIVVFGLFLLTVTGCASVQLRMSDDQTNNERGAHHHSERRELVAALETLEQRPWSEPSERSDGFVGIIFGDGGPSPKVVAESYLASIDQAHEPLETADVVRRDVDETLDAARNVAWVGKRASTALQPVRSDLRTVESAIVETRHCRLVFAETMTKLAKRDGTIDRAEIRGMKKNFNQTILALGRTADALSSRLKDEPAEALASAKQAN